MKRFVLLLGVLFNLSMYGQQEISVISFEQNMSDISARTNRRDDINGQPCALIKVQFPNQDAIFLGSIVGTTPFKTNEYWVYMPQHSTQLEIRTPRTKPLIIDFNQYTNVSVESNGTYELCLVEKPKDAPELYQDAMIDLAHNNTADALGKLATLADEGYAPAIFQLGRNMLLPYSDDFYEDPNSVDTYQEVYSLYKKAAEKGYPDAQYEFAELLMRHLHYNYDDSHSAVGQITVDKHDTDSLYIWSLIRKAADSGVVLAQQQMVVDLKWCEENAAKGNAIAEFAMGLRYDDSIEDFFGAPLAFKPDVYELEQKEKNIHKAVEWYNKAANQKLEEALFRLSTLYRRGYGVERNIEKALSLHIEAAEQGNPQLQFHLAYEYGMGVLSDYFGSNESELYSDHAEIIDRDLTKMAYWLEKMFNHKVEDLKFRGIGACEAMILDIYGNGLYKQVQSICQQGAELNLCLDLLGMMYYEGTATEQDYEKAMTLFRDVDSDRAYMYMGLAYKYGNGVKKDVDKAIELLEKVERNPRASYELGMLYKEKEELGKARKAFDTDVSYIIAGYIGDGLWNEPKSQIDREKNYYHALCDYNFGLMMYERIDGEKNERVVFQHVRDAIKALLSGAVAGYKPSIDFLEKEMQNEIVQNVLTQMGREGNYYQGQLYENGKDYMEAIKWYRKSAEQGYDAAQKKLASIYYNGTGGSRDFSEAAKLYNKMAQKRDPESQYVLGVMYEHGEGVTQNRSEAISWYRRAAWQGNKEAKERLQQMGLCMGALNVNSRPTGAAIQIDGKSYGKTPTTIENLFEGEHSIYMYLQGYVPIEEKFTIKENESSSVSHSLIKEGKSVVQKKNEDDEIFEGAEQNPSFPGGEKEMKDWIRQNLRYPQSAKDNNIQGNVMVQFVVNKDGSIVEPKVYMPVDPDLDKEAIRLISSMPKWIPGKNNGKEIRVRPMITITFRLN